MRAVRTGIILPAILAVLVALSLLSSLAFFDAVLEWRVARLADDRVRARAAVVEGLGEVSRPPDLALLCVSPPLAGEERRGPASGGGTLRVLWRHLGEGVVRAEVEGVGREGARSRVLALVIPDSAERVSGLFRCPEARRLVPVGAGWLEGHPDG